LFASREGKKVPNPALQIRIIIAISKCGGTIEASTYEGLRRLLADHGVETTLTQMKRALGYLVSVNLLIPCGTTQAAEREHGGVIDEKRSRGYRLPR
jgi:hypothetical protein